MLIPAADLVLGVRCAGCGGPALALCRTCGEAIRPHPEIAWPTPAPESLRGTRPVPPIAAGRYTDVLRRVIVAWKEQGNTRLTTPLDHLLAASVLVHVRHGCPVVLVPVPTSRRSRRARGCDLVGELATSSARLLRRVGVDARVAWALASARETVDQVGLDAAERSNNLRGAFRLRSTRLLVGRDIVVVDDILTTGATMTEAVRALSAAGHRPIGAAVVAATPRIAGDRP
ncbi:ComF family protein [Aeromicrobium sp. A1-2]|nr:ComF family protein [Aeromicrobium sp. A1-2]